MTLKLEEKFLNGFVSDTELDMLQGEVDDAYARLINHTGLGNDFHGWVDLPVNYDKEEYARVKAAAEKIKKSCDIFVVIGIGGSYLGARAVLEFLKSNVYNDLATDTPKVYFAGNTISAASMQDLLKICEGKDVCINVISKSGTTTEPAVAFRIFRELLEKKYGVEGSRERIFVTTDKARGTLKGFADKVGYETFVVPDDVGGRFSVLTSVGLLPVAVAGVDLDALMAGAAQARADFTATSSISENTACKYAAIRNILYRKGKCTEILVGYEPSSAMLNEWWKQLYGESEGKENKGLFPASVIFSTDLHSLGQYVQEGQRNIFETVLSVDDYGAKVVIGEDAENIDGLNFLAGKELDFVNKTAMLGTLFAHTDGKVPNILLQLANRSEFSLGYLIYFFEFACAISGYVLGVNPFDQPGVEAYKKNMFALLGKSGYEDLRAELEARMK